MCAVTAHTEPTGQRHVCSYSPYRAHRLLGTCGKLTLRVLMSYTYMEHPFLMFLDHTRRRSTVGRTPLDE